MNDLLNLSSVAVNGPDGTAASLLYLTPAQNLSSPQLRHIANKVQAVINHIVNMGTPEAHFISTALFLGKYASGQGMVARAVRGATAFRGWAFANIAGGGMGGGPFGGKKGDFEEFEFNAKKGSWVWYVVGSLISAAFVVAIKNAMSGKKKKIETAGDVVEFLLETVSRSDYPLFMAANEMFNGHYNNMQTGAIRNAVNSVGKFTAPGATALLNSVIDATDSVGDLIDGDTTKAMQKWRNIDPIGNFGPTDVIWNRLVKDKLFKMIDEDGAYELFKKEIAKQNRNNFKYMVAPGELAGFNAQRFQDENLQKQRQPKKKKGK